MAFDAPSPRCRPRTPAVCAFAPQRDVDQRQPRRKRNGPPSNRADTPNKRPLRRHTRRARRQASLSRGEGTGARAETSFGGRDRAPPGKGTARARRAEAGTSRREGNKVWWRVSLFGVALGRATQRTEARIARSEDIRRIHLSWDRRKGGRGGDEGSGSRVGGSRQTIIE